MSTHCFICLETGKAKYEGIYCQSDGKPEIDGALLTRFYADEKRVRGLLRMGNVSVLGSKIEKVESEEHSIFHRQKDVSLFYGRDFGQKGQDAISCDLSKIDKSNWIDWCYVFTLQKKWQYFRCGELTKKGMKDLR
jgi:hypothetical protein